MQVFSFQIVVQHNIQYGYIRNILMNVQCSKKTIINITYELDALITPINVCLGL